jgi:putative transposase
MLQEKNLSVDEINDYFFIWLRQHYHEKVHSAIKKKPMLCFESDSYPLRRVDLNTLIDAFLLEETRKVDKTGVFRLNKKDYQAPLELVRKTISIRYDPFNLSCIQVYYDGQRYSDAYPLNIPEHVDYRAKPKEADVNQPKTGLNYLELLKEKSQEGLSYYRRDEQDVP